jgi:hypothetical protein
MHQPILGQGRWLAGAVRGPPAYCALPGNTTAGSAFSFQATQPWFSALQRRSR